MIKKNRTSPTLIEVLQDKKIISIKTNSCVTYFLDAEGKVYSAGYFNDSASLGLGKDCKGATLPTEIANLPPIKTIVPCGDHVFLIDYEGGVYGFGNNFNGQLGLGDYERRYLPVKLNLPPIKQIDGFGESNFFVSVDDDLYASGKNTQNQFGLGKENESFNTLQALTHFGKISEVLCSYDHTIFFGKDGNVQVHYRNVPYAMGELLDFSEVEIPIPEDVRATVKHYPYIHSAPVTFPQNSEVVEACYAYRKIRAQECLVRNPQEPVGFAKSNFILLPHSTKLSMAKPETIQQSDEQAAIKKPGKNSC